jgi:hypothetical protein
MPEPFRTADQLARNTGVLGYVEKALEEASLSKPKR